MKRIASILIVLALSALMLTGCSDTADETDNGGMGSADITAANSDTDTTTVSPDDYEKTFEGFIQYMTDGKFIKGEGTDLTASAIGAKQGKRFVMSGTSKYSVELYEYEDQTSEIAQKTIANARGDHSFHDARGKSGHHDCQRKPPQTYRAGKRDAHPGRQQSPETICRNAENDEEDEKTAGKRPFEVPPAVPSLTSISAFIHNDSTAV